MESVESICNGLAKHKVLDGDTVRSLRARWREQAGDKVDQVPEFRRFLVKSGKVTDFQLDLISRGFGDRLYLDDYKLFDRIGVGRSAGVYTAFHTSGQKVAIKVLPPSKAKNQQLLGRFLREARLAVKLDHDNVLRTFHQGQDREGMRFIVMEFLDGETLEEILARRKRLPVGEAVPLMIQALQGLQHLDEKGLIHRDLKPANLILVPGRQPNEPDTTLKSTLKIVDIGLGRALFDEGDPDGVEAHDLTRVGTLLGTMNYMAPEQARDAHTSDIRADIYSLGCVLYEMLAGQPPFPDSNLARQIRRHAEERPKPLTEAVPGLPESLDAIVQKMLAKDPAMRYLTPGQVLKDLKNFMSTHGGEQPAPRAAKPLGTFLTWLETKRTDDDEAPVAATPAPGVPAPIPVPIPVPIPTPGPLPGPAPIPPQVPPQPKPQPQPQPQPVAVGSATSAAVDPGKTVQLSGPPTLGTAAPASVPAPPAPASAALGNAADGLPDAAAVKPPSHAKDASVGSAGVELLRHFGAFVKRLIIAVIHLRPRDWICIASGAATMLILQLLWSLIRRFFGGR